MKFWDIGVFSSIVPSNVADKSLGAIASRRLMTPQWDTVTCSIILAFAQADAQAPPPPLAVDLAQPRSPTPHVTHCEALIARTTTTDLAETTTISASRLDLNVPPLFEWIVVQQ